jgi:predicted kinase
MCTIDCMKPTLILICGLPGSGKSFFANHLSQRIHVNHFNSDILRKELFPEIRTYSETEKKIVYDALIAQTKLYLKKGQSVIIDATFYKKSLRTAFYEIAIQLKAGLKIIYIYAEESLIKVRTSKERIDSEANYSVYLKMKDAFEPIEQNHLSLQSSDNNLDILLTEAISFLNHE